MALNLVAYGNSDESDVSDLEEQTIAPVRTTKKPSLASVLPPPKQPQPEKTEDNLLNSLEPSQTQTGGQISDDEEDSFVNPHGASLRVPNTSTKAEEDIFSLLAHLPKPTGIIPTPPISMDKDDIPKPSAKELALAEQVKLGKLKSEPMKQKTRVKITIPSLKQFDEEEEEDTKPKLKIRSSEGISGLFSVLPPPKTGFSNVVNGSKKSNLIPQQLTRRPTVPPPKKKPAMNKPLIAYESDEEDEGDYFSLTKAAPVFDPHMIEAERLPPLEERTAHIQVKPTIEVYEPPPRPRSPPPGPAPLETVDFDQEALLRLQGKRKREGPVEFLEVSEAQLNPNPQFYQLKALSEEKTDESKFRPGAGPKGLVKTRHQITYLAYQAKAREVELKNTWAQGKASRQQAKQKYGF